MPNAQLNGRQSKIIVSDYHFGNKTLLRSTAAVLAYGTFPSDDALVLYLEAGQTGHLVFKGHVVSETQRTVNATFTYVNGTTPYTVLTYVQTTGSITLRSSNGVLLYLLDVESAWTFFAPPTTSDPNLPADQQLFVLGPYLVRNAAINGSYVAAIGDNVNATTIEIYTGRPSVNMISWNGAKLLTEVTEYGSLKARIPGTTNRTVSLPILSDWHVADSLPEKDRGYDDSAWTICNKTTTLSQASPLTLPVLFSSDYGYYAGQKLYRGYFDGKTATSANVTAQGVLASGWSAWLNGQLVGGSPGNATLTATWDVLDFSGATLYDTANVLTITTDYTGHDETSTGPSGAENPRALLGAVLYGPGSNTTQNFTTCKIQGNAGASANIDPVRGPMNDGGTHGERLGWHLPGFKPSNSLWSLGSSIEGLNKSGISWYITTFSLSLDTDLDVPISLEISAPTGTTASIQIYMNGYQYGKFIPQIGPQPRFPSPPGVINNQGVNTLALSLWAQTGEGARLDTVELFRYGVYESGFDFSQNRTYLQPGWTADRLRYA